MSNITLETVSESLLPVVADAELDLAFVNGQYSIVNYDDMMSTLRSLQEQINSYSYQVEDRQAVKKFKAAVNNTDCIIWSSKSAKSRINGCNE